MKSEMDRLERVLRNLDQSKPPFRPGEMGLLGPNLEFRTLRDTDDPRDVYRVLRRDLGRHWNGD